MPKASGLVFQNQAVVSQFHWSMARSRPTTFSSLFGSTAWAGAATVASHAVPAAAASVRIEVQRRMSSLLE